MDRRSSSSSVASVAALAAMLVVASSSGGACEAYVSSSSLRRSSLSPAGKVRRSPAVAEEVVRNRQREDGSPLTLHLFPSSPPSVVASSGRRRRRPQDSAGSAASGTGLPATMSDSVLAASDTLPSFRSAHGLLSPEVVARIADANDLVEDSPLHRFLKTYRRNGPVACLPMLSDPCVLPELTRAMREIEIA
mmetsp:Transcript_5075/g.10965  ORF Transcript_5075/g.10965 Transcript_5075/m.10965 type:complete len:192 (-) Transcript_5075:160-735(-)